MLTYDDVLLAVGEFGRFQRFQYFLLCLVSIVAAFHAFNMVFIGATPVHHCNVDPTVSQLSSYLILKINAVPANKSNYNLNFMASHY